jgi:hypothetical protein
MTAKPTVFLDGHGLSKKGEDDPIAELKGKSKNPLRRNGKVVTPKPKLVTAEPDRPLTPEEELLIEGLPEEEQELARNLSAEERSDIFHRISEKRQIVSPPGTFPWLNAHQEKKRLEYLIADPFWTHELAALDWVYIYQIPYRQVVAPGTRIIMPSITQERYSKDGPRGVVVDAGPLALEFMWTNGFDLGHTVTFARHAPWRVTMANILGQEEVALVMKAGDIIASEEAAKERAAGRLKYVLGDDGRVTLWTPEKRLTPKYLGASDEAM